MVEFKFLWYHFIFCHCMVCIHQQLWKKKEITRLENLMTHHAPTNRRSLLSGMMSVVLWPRASVVAHFIFDTNVRTTYGHLVWKKWSPIRPWPGGLIRENHNNLGMNHLTFVGQNINVVKVGKTREKILSEKPSTYPLSACPNFMLNWITISELLLCSCFF